MLGFWEMTRCACMTILASGNLHYRRTFDLDNKNEISGKNLLKVVKFQNLVEKCCIVYNIEPYQTYQVCIFSNKSMFLYYVWKFLPFLSQKW